MDFVTNSSSSSFILGFKNKEKVASDLVNAFDDDTMEYFPVAFADARNKENVISEDDIIERINDYYSWDVEYHLYHAYRNECHVNGKTALDRDAWKNLPDSKLKIETKMNEIIEDAKKKMKGKTYFVEVEYSDHEYSELEHSIMPRCKNLIIDFCNH